MGRLFQRKNNYTTVVFAVGPWRPTVIKQILIAVIKNNILQNQGSQASFQRCVANGPPMWHYRDPALAPGSLKMRLVLNQCASLQCENCERAGRTL
jgi:hypothetical protein